MYTVASPDPTPRGRGQLPNPNECRDSKMRVLAQPTTFTTFVVRQRSR